MPNPEDMTTKEGASAFLDYWKTRIKEVVLRDGGLQPTSLILMRNDPSSGLLVAPQSTYELRTDSIDDGYWNAVRAIAAASESPGVLFMCQHNVDGTPKVYLTFQHVTGTASYEAPLKPDPTNGGLQVTEFAKAPPSRNLEVSLLPPKAWLN